MSTGRGPRYSPRARRQSREGVLVGLDIGVQVVSFDVGNAYHEALSNALELVFGSY